MVVADAAKKLGDVTGAIRFLAVAANGDVYVKTANGGIIALRETRTVTAAPTRRRPSARAAEAALPRDGYLYHSTTSAVYRYK